MLQCCEYINLCLTRDGSFLPNSLLFLLFNPVDINYMPVFKFIKLLGLEENISAMKDTEQCFYK